ncbi:NUDIX hydrolase [Leucobacter denitrificans]|uniref:NUDIX hydrolase n=1 Tax=Leucobacter denitrificans TaxID=683042 RepID=A0A7G9S3R9_9MICO|nr:NUDIX domain-containing protein [Leucobacter denitrificans]QNN62494.1 NUDIX hydrolase [Leucobacter denitrificans]
MAKRIFAAGTIPWRIVTDEAGKSQLMVLLIHRTKQRDVSFPKGKLDPGESMPQAAVRETREETGLKVKLGVCLGTINYELPNGAEKIVQYWAAKVTPKKALASTFKPNGEIQALEWVLAKNARELLTYEADRELFDVFMRLTEPGLIDTFSVTLLRHAKAEPRSETFPVDHQRPLSPTGLHQAEMLAPILASFGPKRIYSSTADRCLSTVAPLAHLLGKGVRERVSLSQGFWDTGDLAETRKLIGKIVKRGKSVVVCSHRPVLPDLARELVLASGSLPGSYLDEATALPPAGFSVFHFSKKRPGAGILGVETYPLKHGAPQSTAPQHS